MEIDELILVKYVARPNRFTIEFKNEYNNIGVAHLHDPGRLKELLIEDTDVLVRYVPTYNKTGRKTKYDVIAIKYFNDWVLLNSSFHNKIVSELVENRVVSQLSSFHVYKAEYTIGNSRLDFLLKNEEDEKMFLEVKGCTLVVNNLALFPDAPTARGKKHLEELINIRNKGFLSTAIILILQNSAKCFSPNRDTDIEFSNTLTKAHENGVMILPVHMTTEYEENTLKIVFDKILPIKL